MLIHTLFPFMGCISIAQSPHYPSKKTSFLLTILGILLASPAFSTNYTWTGSVNNNWSNPNNWSPVTGQYPSAADNATISGGTVVLDVNSSINELNFEAGTISGSNDLVVAGIFTWSGGTYSGTGLLRATSELYLVGADDKFVANGEFVLNGAGYLTEGNLLIGNGAKFTVQGAVFNCDHASDAIIGGNGGGVFEVIEGGEFNLNGGTTTSIQCIFNTSCTVLVNAGVLDFGAGSTSSFTTCDMWVGGGATVRLSGGVHNFEAASNINGGGNLDIFGATVNFSGTSGIECYTSFAGGVIGGGGEASFVGYFSWNSGTFAHTDAGASIMGGDLDIVSNSPKSVASNSLEVTGNCTWRGGDISVESGAAFNVQSSASFYMLHTGLQNLGNLGFVSLDGLCYKTGTGTTNLNGIVIFSSYFSISKGQVVATASSFVEMTGHVSISDGASFKIAGGTHYFGGNVFAASSTGGHFLMEDGTVEYGSGLLNSNLTISGGTLNANTNFNPKIFQQTGGTFTGTGNHLITKTMQWTGGTISGSGTITVNLSSNFPSGNRILSEKMLTLNGNAEWSDGTFDLSNNATLTIGPVATFKIMHTGQTITGIGNVIVNGTVDLMNNSISVCDDISCMNNGSVVGNGTLSLGEMMNYNLVSPGPQIGKITVGDFNNASGTLRMEIKGASPASGYDQLVIQNAGQLDGTISVQLSGGFVPAAGNSFDLVVCSSCAGNFLSVDTSQAALPFPLYWSMDYSNGFKLKVESLSLPVELLDFQAVAEDDEVHLTWRTASETNNRGFEILRSTEGSTWETIGFVEGQGDSRTTVNYDYLDKPNENGTYYYQLRQLDFDGKYALSELRSATFTTGFAEGFQVFPNPVLAGGQVTLVFPEGQNEVEQLSIINQLGQIVQQLTLTDLDAKQVVLPLALPSGSYYLRMNDGQVQTVRPLVVK